MHLKNKNKPNKLTNNNTTELIPYNDEMKKIILNRDVAEFLGFDVSEEPD